MTCFNYFYHLGEASGQSNQQCGTKTLDMGIWVNSGLLLTNWMTWEKLLNSHEMASCFSNERKYICFYEKYVEQRIYRT